LLAQGLRQAAPQVNQTLSGQRVDYPIDQMKRVLAGWIERYLAGEFTATQLRHHAYEQHHVWSQVDDDQLPGHSEEDRVYWAAIYTVFLLGDEPPEYHTTDEDLPMYLDCLRGLRSEVDPKRWTVWRRS